MVYIIIIPVRPRVLFEPAGSAGVVWGERGQESQAMDGIGLQYPFTAQNHGGAVRRRADRGVNAPSLEALQQVRNKRRLPSASQATDGKQRCASLQCLKTGVYGR